MPEETTPAATTTPAETTPAVTPPAVTTLAAAPPPAAPPVTTTEPARTDGEPPKAPEKYELVLPVDTKHLTDADLEAVAVEAKALGLTNEQAQGLVQARESQLSAMSTQFLDEAKADPEIGGAKFEETVKHALVGRDWLFPEGGDRDLIIGWFDRTGLGNHKAFLRAMARIGKARAEDTPVSGSTSTGNAERIPTEDVLFPSSAKKSA